MAAVPSALPPTFHHQDFTVDDLVDAKGPTRVSVCLPARDEAATVGPIVEAIRARLMDDARLVDELLVVDDHSSDRTGEIAAAAGARVVRTTDGQGKGEALWTSMLASDGDLVVWCDADVREFDIGFVVGLLGPLLTQPHVDFVKGFYERPLNDRQEGGGRVTELVARPLVALLFPELGGIVQPLSGEYAGRRSVLEQLPFVQGYGVDLGLLIDVVRLAGPEAIAQVDLGVRLHRNRSLGELSPQAMAVMQTALRRAGLDSVGASAVLTRPGEPPVRVDVAERPPPVESPGYRGKVATTPAERLRPSG